ncbi:MAG: hypothetical protein WC340_05465 [Kiritimatiellia bacterium]
MNIRAITFDAGGTLVKLLHVGDSYYTMDVLDAEKSGATGWRLVPIHYS